MVKMMHRLAVEVERVRGVALSIHQMGLRVSYKTLIFSVPLNPKNSSFFINQKMVPRESNKIYLFQKNKLEAYQVCGQQHTTIFCIDIPPEGGG